jgi:hypothetical protein
MIKLIKIFILAAIACTLSGCFGGTVATQIVRAIATKVADKAVAQAMDVDEDQATSNRKPKYDGEPSPYKPKQQPTNTKPLQNDTPDPDHVALWNASFAQGNANSEGVPEQTAEIETDFTAIQVNQLVRVELFNLLIGNEKAAVYDKARLIGATSLPNARDWQYWQVATGEIKTEHSPRKQITFLIPPEMGKLPSGTITMVEIASPGELNVARYKAN